MPPDLLIAPGPPIIHCLGCLLAALACQNKRGKERGEGGLLLLLLLLLLVVSPVLRLPRGSTTSSGNRQHIGLISRYVGSGETRRRKERGRGRETSLSSFSFFFFYFFFFFFFFCFFFYFFFVLPLPC